MSACFVDYDRDGWLDLVAVNYVKYDVTTLCYDGQGRRDYCHPSQFPGPVAKLYRNLGVAGGAQSAERGAQESALRAPRSALPVRFEDVTEIAGLSRLPGPWLGV